MNTRELERVAGGRLMVGIRGSGPHDAAFRADVEACREAGVGGVILFDVHAPEMARLVAAGVGREEARRRAVRNVESPAQLRELVGLLRAELGAELLVAIDQEGGAVARLGPARGFAPTVSAAEFARLGPEARRRAAAELARPLVEAGIDINFAPCVDVALALEGAIARAGRCFGADAAIIIACAREVIAAHTAAGIATCLKHFPGHGSAGGDSHEELPDITDGHDPDLELSPYRALCAVRSAPRVPIVMTGHLLDRHLDPELPASLSPAITAGLLRREIGFEGVIVTDSLDMRAVRDRWPAPEAAVLALRAGADLALDAHNLPQPDGAERACEAVAMRDAIVRAVGEGALEADCLRASAQRVARAWRPCHRGRGEESRLLDTRQI